MLKSVVFIWSLDPVWKVTARPSSGRSFATMLQLVLLLLTMIMFELLLVVSDERTPFTWKVFIYVS